MRSQLRFPVVTFVLVTLTGFAIISKLLAPYVVAPNNRRLLNTRSEFISAALHQHIAWYPLSDRAFQDARRLDRPILLVIGAPWSLTGRMMDAQVFSDVSIQKVLARELICIRVDTVETPDWLSAYMPYSRLQDRLFPDFQIWMLDPEGRLFHPIALGAAQHIPTEIEFSDEIASSLVELQKQKDAAIDAGGLVTTVNPQTSDLSRLQQAPVQLIPDLAAIQRNVAGETAVTPFGGFPLNRQQRLTPMAWNYLFAASGADAVQPSVVPLLKSPTTDLVDGGFFYRSSSIDWSQPSFDKVAALNGEMCVLLARLAQREPNGPYLYFARATFDSLAGEFLDTQGMIRPCRIGDERQGSGRSAHSSFSPRDLHRLISGQDSLFRTKDEQWALQNLHLQPQTNPLVVPYVTDFAMLQDPTWSRVLQKLHQTPSPATFDQEVTLDSAAATASRLLEAARLMGDPARSQKADDLIARLDVFRHGNDVVHELLGGERAQPTLGDYLAYVDAQLQDFLTHGRVASLETGATVLETGLTRFAYPNANCYQSGVADGLHRRAPDSNSPQLCDDNGESSNAKVIRLAWCFGRLLANSTAEPDRRLAARLLQQASNCVTQFADLASTSGSPVAGYALAASLTRDDTFVVCVGPDPAKMVQAMCLREPNRMVAPAAGPVYPALLKKPGYYVVRRGQLVGPMSLETAASQLPQTLVTN